MIESGAILLYLAEKTGRFLPKDLRELGQELRQASAQGPDEEAHRILFGQQPAGTR